MRQHYHPTLLFMATLLAFSIPSHAQEMDIEQADSLNFHSFHKDKKEAIKAWEKPSETVKAYEDKTAAAKSAQTSNTSQNNTSAAASAPATTSAPANSTEIKGKRFEIRERYTLSRSTQTPYSAFYVIEPLYKQAAQLCTKGWKKLSEWSVPIEQDFYLHYEIECL